MSYFDKLSGTSFRQKEIDALTGEETLVLVADPTNEYDEYAVRVDTDSGVMIGWIRKGNNQKISKLLQEGKEVRVEEFTITGGEGEDKDGRPMNYGVNVKIKIPGDENFKKFKKLIPDIGEGFVYFDEEEHVYYDEAGNRMVSGSMMEEEETGKPDMSYAAEAMAKSTRIPKKKILEMWERNGEISAAFGTVIHDSLDFYIKNQVEMQSYDNIKERPHKASNWFPNTVGDIIDAYLEEHDVSNARGEVFIRYGNFCGFIDQIVYLDDKLVKIRDYKIVNKLKNVKTKTFGTVLKYTVQQNFYRALLVANGYGVESMALNTYDGEEWEDVRLEEVAVDVGQAN